MTATRQIRVAHVITKMALGGAQESAITTCTGLSKGDFDQVLLTGLEVDDEGSLFDDASAQGVRILEVPTLIRAPHPIQDLRTIRRLTLEFRRWTPDVVHTHSSKAGFLGRVAGRLAGVPSIVHSVHGWSFHDDMGALERGLVVRAERLVARVTDVLVVESSTDLPKGLRRRIGRRSQYALIRNGIDLRRFGAGRREALRSELATESASWLVGTVGRLADQKDPCLMVEAFALLSGRIPDAEFVWVGDGPLRQVAEQRAQDLGVGDRFHFVGVRRDVPDVLAALDCFALSSRWEGLPRTVTEAMASGVPVVATAVDGTTEVIENGECGLLVESGDAVGLADAIVAVRTDRHLADRLATRGLERSAWFSQERMCQDLSELYRDLVAGRPPGRFRRPIKVVHVITGLDYGGAERQLQALVSSGHPEVEHEIVSLTGLGPIGVELRRAGVRITSLDIDARHPDIRDLWRLRSVLREASPDVVQTWLYHSDLLGGLAARSLRLPLIWSVRMTWMDATRTKRGTMAFARAAARLSARMPSAIVFNSESGRRTHAEHGYDTSRSFVVGNGIDVDRFRPDETAGATLRHRLGVSDGAYLIGAIGRFDPQKGLDIIAAAVADVVRSGLPVHLVLAGPGIVAGTEELVRMLRSYRIDELTTLLGPLDDVQPVMAGLDVLVSASTYGESVPNVVVEAAACGVPVVATDVGDVHDIVRRGRVVRAGDPTALVAGLLDVLRSESEHPLGLEADVMSIDEMVESYLRIYRGVLDDQHSAAIDVAP